MDGYLAGYMSLKTERHTNPLTKGRQEDRLWPAEATIAFAECNRAGNGMGKVTSA